MDKTLIHEHLEYNPDTGIFIWKLSNRKNKAGDVAGRLNRGNGYLQIGLGGYQLTAHRLAWLYVYGKLPSGNLDHINGDKLDNRISNLRLASYSENACNRKLRSDNTSGLQNIHRSRNSWRVSVGKGRDRKSRCFPYTEEGLIHAKLYRDELLRSVQGGFSRFIHS